MKNLFESVASLFQSPRLARGSNSVLLEDADWSVSQDDLIQIYRSPAEAVESPVQIDVLEVSLGTGKVNRSDRGIVLGEVGPTD